VGGTRIKRILRSRLPERLAGSLPPFLVEVAVGVLLTGFFAAARLALAPLTGEIAPYTFVFVATVGAAVLAGWRSGLTALLLGQTLIWYFLTEPRGTFAAKDVQHTAGLVLATVSQLAILAIITLYQREIERAWSRREGQMDLLEKALKEIDHRTANNYQTVIALVLAQAKGSEGQVRDALIRVADRIRAIADAQRKLALASVSLEQVKVSEHLQDLCASLKRGLTGDGVELHCQFDDITLGADETVCVSILLNELVTNALKHAFPAGRKGSIAVGLHGADQAVELTVEDDGVGIQSTGTSRGSGLGSKLVRTFVRQLKAKHEVSSDGSGTRHRIRIPR
jgi:two-component sensor histidine kinase